MSRSNNESLQLYQNNPTATAPAQRWSGHATVVTTTTTTSVSDQLSRVTRPNNTRRRSRASRRTPTTLLNTDTTNFRAMVQRFTGCGDSEAATFPENESSAGSNHQLVSSYYSGSSGFNDGFGSSGGYDVQFRPPHRQQYFTMPVDDGGGQHLGFGQGGSYKAANPSDEEMNYLF